MTVRPSDSPVFAVTVCSLPSRRTTTGKVSPGLWRCTAARTASDDVAGSPSTVTSSSSGSKTPAEGLPSGTPAMTIISSTSLPSARSAVAVATLCEPAISAAPSSCASFSLCCGGKTWSTGRISREPLSQAWARS